MGCRKCQTDPGRKQLREADGLCQECAAAEHEDRRVVQDLVNSFSGRGKPGFVRLMELGNFLSPMKDEAAVNWHNNICMVIETMITPDMHGELLSRMADVILDIAGTQVE